MWLQSMYLTFKYWWEPVTVNKNLSVQETNSHRVLPSPGYNEGEKQTEDRQLYIPSSLRSHTRRVLSLDAETSMRLPSGANVKSRTTSV